jgi:hypothetical protein
MWLRIHARVTPAKAPSAFPAPPDKLPAGLRRPGEHHGHRQQEIANEGYEDESVATSKCFAHGPRKRPLPKWLKRVKRARNKAARRKAAKLAFRDQEG